MTAQTTRARNKFSPEMLFWPAWGLLLAVKMVIASKLGLSSDEAFYWQESRALDWSYSDVPPLTAWLIHFGETLFGHSELAVRGAFLLLGAWIPLLVARLGSRLFGSRDGWYAGVLALGLPLVGCLGLLALPDVPLTFFAMLALLALERAVSDNRIQDWTMLGLALAGAWLSHYRAAMLILAGVAFLLFTERGRSLWPRVGLWLALGLSLIGVWPILWFNINHNWVAFTFQLIDRHPWSFHIDGFAQLAEQALLYTPCMYALLLAAAVGCWWRARREEAPWDLLSCVALVPLLGYFILGFFADDVRMRVHWPLLGYLPLLPVMPGLLRDLWLQRDARIRSFFKKACVVFSVFGSGVGLALLLGYFALAADAQYVSALAKYKAFPEHFVGNREAATVARKWLTNPRFASDLLVADNFALAAAIDFQFNGSEMVYTLDHALNRKHGRAPQLAIWQRNEAALRSMAPVSILLIVEPTAGRERGRGAWLRSICDRASDLQLLDRLDLFDGRKKYRFYQAQIADPPAEEEREACRVLTAANN